MLLGFRDAIKEGTFSGSSVRYLAMGLEFLDNMVNQSANQVEMVKKEEKEMVKRAKEAVLQAGGQVSNA